jgi:hypothetical protein
MRGDAGITRRGALKAGATVAAGAVAVRALSDAAEAQILRRFEGQPAVGTIIDRSAQKIATTQIVNRKHDALEIVPPDDRRDIRIGLPHRCRDLPQHGKAVICLQ